MHIERKIKIGFVVSIVVMLFTAVVPFHTVSRATVLRDALLASEAKILQLTNVLSLMKDAETGQRGFIITGQDTFLAPYNEALARLDGIRKALRESLAAGHQQREAGQIDALLERKLNDLARTIELRRSGGFEAVRPVVVTAQGKQYMDEVRTLIGRLTEEEDLRRRQFQSDADQSALLAARTVFAATIVNVILVMVALSFLFRLLKRHRTTADELRVSRDQLGAGMLELRQRNAEMAMLAQMARILDSSTSLNEALESIAVYCRKLLPQASGELFLYRNSRNVLEKAVHWGRPHTPSDAIEPHECWGLRLGQVHRVMKSDDLFCFHHDKGPEQFRQHLCIPLTAQGEVHGLICIEAGSPEHDTLHIGQSDQDLAVVMAEQLSLALSNIKLKEMLKQQSIVDPLTGLFNRRYMDETLQRELARARRKSMPLALVMIDVDHFKSINDRFGHEAGDEALRTIALRIRENVREGDLVCRFGGEEIVIVMPECGATDAYLRADRIRQAVRSIDIQHGGHRIGPVTASFGIASFPQDATEPGALAEAADGAMYEAKRLGRDLVMMAGQEAIATA